MWPPKRYAFVFLLGIGLLTALLGANGQDQRLPWPPRPVQPPDIPVVLDPPPVAKQPNKTPKKNSLPNKLVIDSAPIVQVSAQGPDVPKSSEPPPPAPPPLVQSPAIVTQEPKGPEIPLPGVPATPSPDPNQKPNAAPPELFVPTPSIPDVVASPSPKISVDPPRPIAIDNGPRPVQNNPKTITISPSLPAPVVTPAKDFAPESARLPAFRVVAPIRKSAPPVPEPGPLPPPVTPREPFAVSSVPPRPATEERPPLSGAQTPVLTFEKIGPQSVPANQVGRFEIIVRNAGSIAAQKIQVEDELPPGARWVGAEPQPVFRGDRFTWIIDTLPPGAERRLMLDLQASAVIDWGTNTTVTTSATKFARANVPQPALPLPPQQTIASTAQPALSLRMKGPAGAAVGQPVTFDIEMINNANYPLTGMVLQAIVPPGLSHPLGDKIEADIDAMPPLSNKSFPLQTTASKAGKHVILIKVVLRDGKEVTAQAAVQISVGGVGLRPAGNSRLMRDRPDEIQLELVNYTDKPVRNVAVTETLPEGLTFIQASDKGTYKAKNRSVSWTVDQLAPGKTKMLTMKVRPDAAGEFIHHAVAKIKNGEEAKLSSAVKVESIADLQLKIAARDNPVEVGRQATYAITVHNQGSAAATGVRVRAFVPEGMRPAAARGPTAYQVNGQEVAFEELPRLEARKHMVFEVAALAQSAGDRRVRVQVTSDQMSVPIAREERTWVYVE